MCPITAGGCSLGRESCCNDRSNREWKGTFCGFKQVSFCEVGPVEYLGGDYYCRRVVRTKWTDDEGIEVESTSVAGYPEGWIAAGIDAQSSSIELSSGEILTCGACSISSSEQDKCEK